MNGTWITLSAPNVALHAGTERVRQSSSSLQLGEEERALQFFNDLNPALKWISEGVQNTAPASFVGLHLEFGIKFDDKNSGRGGCSREIHALHLAGSSCCF